MATKRPNVNIMRAVPKVNHEMDIDKTNEEEEEENNTRRIPIPTSGISTNILTPGMRKRMEKDLIERTKKEDELQRLRRERLMYSGMFIGGVVLGMVIIKGMDKFEDLFKPKK